VGFQNLYVLHRALIEQAIAAVCRRHRLSGTDAEDFSSAVRLHLLDDDCSVLRRFEGRSSLKTFLVAVVGHLFLDWRNARWGKWRPSVEAKRQGPVAMLLERLVVRDQLSFDEALEMLRTNHHINESRSTLESMAARFPARAGRRLVSADILDAVADPTPHADTRLLQSEARDEAEPVRRALRKALAALPAQDRLILRLRFIDGFTFANIANTLGLDPKPLYRRVERLMQQLRARLEAEGVGADETRELLEFDVFDGPLPLDSAGAGTTPHAAAGSPESERRSQ
jgi:RNA polymerase sigma factor (sigma-70 family)